MKIGLIDVDGHNFPNLALMKISAFHKSQGDNVEFATMFNIYDIIYKSKVFTFTPDDEYAFNCDEYVNGGTGYDLSIKLPDDINSRMPDYSLYNCKTAYGFLTRGCIRKCKHCFVPEKEGNIRAENDIEDFIGKYKTAILMDNNVLACEHGIKQIEKISKMKIKIDFNQGLDFRLIDDSIINIISKIRWIRFIRLACDDTKNISGISKVIEKFKKHGIKPYRLFFYVLVEDVPDAMIRVHFLKSYNCEIFAQVYRDKKNIEPTEEQKNFCRWVNRKAIFKSIDFKDYRGKK